MHLWVNKNALENESYVKINHIHLVLQLRFRLPKKDD